MIIDETTDVSTKKGVSFSNSSMQRRIMEYDNSLHKLIELIEGNAEAIFQAIIMWSTRKRLHPLTNIIGFAADTVN